jgi:hypothetical protein
MHQKHRHMSHLLAQLEAAQCLARKQGDTIRARIPGFEPPAFAAMLGLEDFWDEVLIELNEEGRPRARLLYGTPIHLAIHGLITAMFALDFWLRGIEELSIPQFLLVAALANALPWGIAQIQAHGFLHYRVFKKA